MSSRLLLEEVAALILLGACCGCAVRRAASFPSYRLTKIDTISFLLPPDFSQKSKDAMKTPVALGNLGGNSVSGRELNCSIQDRWYSLDRRHSDGAWVARLPAPRAWNDQIFVSHSQAYWDRFLAQVNELQSEGCITPKEYEQATNWLEESFPAPVALASLFRDPLGRQGITTLKPGMRLFVERSIFRPESAETVSNYIGESKVYYRVVRRGDGEIGLKLTRVQKSKGLKARTLRRFPDATLEPKFKSMGAIRLFYLTLYVPPALERNGLLVGVRDPKDMNGLVRKIKKDPEVPCTHIEMSNIACASFTGMVSASMEVSVWVNGKREYLPANTTVESLLRSLPSTEWKNVWSSLRIWRMFRGKLYRLEFSRDDPAAHHLVLFAGDRITWRHDSVSGK
jgi:hypothetical protein